MLNLVTLHLSILGNGTYVFNLRIGQDPRRLTNWRCIAVICMRKAFPDADVFAMTAAANECTHFGVRTCIGTVQV